MMASLKVEVGGAAAVTALRPDGLRFVTAYIVTAYIVTAYIHFIHGGR